MASACVNLPVSPPHHPNPTTFLTIPWLSPTITESLSSDSSSDFEFCHFDLPVAHILPADQLFSNGQLLTTTATTVNTQRNITDDVGYIFSPKAPRCSSRWREILGLKNKKVYTPHSIAKTTSSRKSINFSNEENTKTTSSSALIKLSTEENNKTTSSRKSFKNSTEENAKTTSSSKSIKRFLQKNTKSPTSDTSLSLPLLDSSSVDSLTDSNFSISTSRLSLSSLSSSTSSTQDHDDLHRHSLDETRPRVTLLRPKPNPVPVSTRPVRRTPKPARSAGSGTGTGTGVSVDSPRMNSAGKIVFQSLNRSSSSPSSFNGGPRYKHRGMERSYSANVRITPVLNVPVCSSLRGSSKSGGFGFGQLFTSSSSASLKKDKGCDKKTVSKSLIA